MTFLATHVVAHLREVASRPEIPGGRYRIGHAIGRGGMATVFLARDERLDREVALKVSNITADAVELDERLRREARVLARLEHPGIVPVHDAGTLLDGRVFYVMKLVRGDTLADHAARLPTETARLAVLERVVEAVAFAHAGGIVHRDLKPGNVMVGRFGEVLVVDWGVAKLLQELEATGAGEPYPGAPLDESSTRTGTLLGTPGFMAPEQARGEVHRVGPATDVFALGALLYWLFTSETPPAAGSVARALADRAPTLPRRLRAIVARALAPEPDDRYAHAGELADDLARYRSGLAVVAYPEGPLDRVGRVVATHRVVILLVAAYLLMRALVAFLQR